MRIIDRLLRWLLAIAKFLCANEGVPDHIVQGKNGVWWFYVMPDGTIREVTDEDDREDDRFFKLFDQMYLEIPGGSSRLGTSEMIVVHFLPFGTPITIAHAQALSGWLRTFDPTAGEFGRIDFFARAKREEFSSYFRIQR